MNRGSFEEDPNQQQSNIKARMMATGNSLLDDAVSPPSNTQQRASQQKAHIAQSQQKPKQPINVDDQVIPTLNQKSRSNPPQEYEDGGDPGDDETRDQAEPLKGDNAVKAQPIVNAFGEMVGRKLFSRTW